MVITILLAGLLWTVLYVDHLRRLYALRRERERLERALGENAMNAAYLCEAHAGPRSDRQGEVRFPPIDGNRAHNCNKAA
ncbi:MAG: hypothetical protein QM296_01535 [Bacillota bacterium]|nr:hypothetical protein [Bacillota bacterium]